MYVSPEGHVSASLTLLGMFSPPLASHHQVSHGKQNDIRRTVIKQIEIFPLILLSSD